jgi:hypothetical protein
MVTIRALATIWSLPPGFCGISAKEVLIWERAESRKAPEALPKRA